MGSGPKKLAKGDSESEKKIVKVQRISQLFGSCFSMMFAEASLDGLFPIWVAKVFQMSKPCDHFSKHFAGKLEL